jgi:hypothetical protein
VLEGTESSFTTKLAKGLKGRAKMMVLMSSLMFATDQLIHKNDVDRDFNQIMGELGPEFGQLLVDVLPFVGTASNYYSAFSGREIVTNRDVSGGWDRTSNVIWGTVGLAGDAVTVLGAVPSGGTSIAANALLRLTAIASKGGRMGKLAEKTIARWPKIIEIAERMGGWKNFTDKAFKFRESANGAKVLKGLKSIEKVGMVSGTLMLGTGLYTNLRYGFTDNETELEIPEDLNIGQSAYIQTPPEALPEAA